MQIIKYNSAEHNLADIDILKQLPPDSLRSIEQKCTWLQYGPDDIILDPIDADKHEVYFLVEGNVRIENNRSARVRGTDHCIIARMDRDDFINLLIEAPKLALHLIESFAKIIRSLNERVTSLTSLTPHQRIYMEFLRISEPNPNGDGTWIINVVPTHKEIASWSGTNKSEVANAIGGLFRNGVLERQHRSFKIKDRTTLKLLAGLS